MNIRLKTRTWCLISLVMFLASGVLWWLGNRHQQRLQLLTPPPLEATNAAAVATNSSARGAQSIPLLSTSASLAQNPPSASPINPRSPRLANTAKGLKELMRSETAILLRNALLDTAEPKLADIPESLRAHGDPGSYIVQSRGPIDDAFRARLQEANAQVVSYIPNNAYLVRAEAAAAGQLTGVPGIQAVLPYEPYYKLEQRLLTLVLEEQSLREGDMLNVTLFPGDAESGRLALAQLGVEVAAAARSPFGSLLTIRPNSASLPAIAQLQAVQMVERYHVRKLANDITRQVVAVSENTTNTTNYLNLTGTNVLVNINDSGVDATHPDLQGRVLAVNPAYLNDPQGHGTHVAGIIASSGGKSDTVTNAMGSVSNANFRGMAPGSKLFVLPADILTGPLISDTYLQETAAGASALISNNSWIYDDTTDYDSAAASYDSAVRDALPEQPGMQPLVYVFAAGNHGGGNEDGTGGEPENIRSPGTAKNVITVGAMDHYRYITNEVWMLDNNGEVVTNTPFIADTDSNDQVSGYSSRGNVGIEVEGVNGRFKPDLVAPGSFIVSTRAKGWQMDTNPPKVLQNFFFNQLVSPGGLNNYSIYVPSDTISLELRVRPSVQFTNVFPGLPLYVRFGDFADPTVFDVRRTNQVILPGDFPLRPGDWYYTVGNNSQNFILYDVQTLLVRSNSYGNYFQVLQKLNDDLGPYYRYESGTSMAAPVVSGMLALMKEFFEQKLPAGKRLTNSPALMKALLINGAHSANPRYNLSPKKSMNIQGWGMVDLTNSLPAALTNGVTTNGPMVLIDQNTANSLATLQSKTWSVTVSEQAQGVPMKFTLVWTDPPGNPAASIKLVNDLDLVVTNLDSGVVYFGNDIPEESDYTDPWNTNAPPNSDLVNNVENVFLRDPQGTNFTVTVLGRRVNVNAVTAHTNQVAQDYALVISCADLTLTNAITLKVAQPPAPVFQTTNLLALRAVKNLTNGIPLMNERVGANSPLVNWTNGPTYQWNFYVFTNSPSPSVPLGITNGPNVAFMTFLPPNLSRPRNLDADIDLYVSGNPALTNLDPVVLLNADKSVQRGGTEYVFYTNAALGQVYYIAVKSEDQQAAEYGFIGLSSRAPFAYMNNGSQIVQFFPLNLDIPDGTPDRPGHTNVFGLATFPMPVGRVIVTNLIWHQDLGDVVGNLSHGNQFAVLENHSLNSGFFTGTNLFIYDDSNQGDIPGSRPTDGPGSLLRFRGLPAIGPWFLDYVDNAWNHTGRVINCTIRIDPQPPLLGLPGKVAPNSWEDFIFDVPPEATNLIIQVWDIKPPLPLDLFVQWGSRPRANSFDKHIRIDPNVPFDPLVPTMQIGMRDVPPLRPGRYYISIFNPNGVPVDFRIDAHVQFNLSGGLVQKFRAPKSPLLLKDDALTVSTNFIPVDREIVDVRLGLRIDHPRVSDLSVHLVSPQGTRVLITENRGGPLANGYGFGLGTNISYAVFGETTNYPSIPIKFALPPFTNSILGPIRYQQDFETVPPRVYPTGDNVAGWPVRSSSPVKPVTVLTDTNLANSGTNLLDLAGGWISRTMFVTAGRDYELSVAFRKFPAKPGMVSWWRGDQNGADVYGRQNALLAGGVTFEPAVVSTGMRFNGVNGYGLIRGNLADLSSPVYTVEGWIKPLAQVNAAQVQSLIFGQAFGRAQLVVRPGTTGVQVSWQFADSRFSVVTLPSSREIPIGQFTHVAGTWDGVTLGLYLNGVLDATLTPAKVPRASQGGFYIGGFNENTPGNRLTGQFFNGVIDELSFYNVALSAADLDAIVKAGPQGKCGMFISPDPCPAVVRMTVNGVNTNDLMGGPGWDSFTLPFTAAGNTITVQFQNTVGDMLLDDILLRQKGSIYLPEESMELFRGERGLGNWRLEVSDDRVGSKPGLPPVLLSWELQFIFAAPAFNATLLTNGIPNTNIVAGIDTTYFIVDVPLSAHYATNTLIGNGDLILIGSKSGLPVGDPLYDDYYVDQRGPNAGEYLLLSTAQPLTAPLQPGGRYYLGVRNVNPNQTNVFIIQVDFDQIDQPTNLSVITLLSGVPYSNIITNSSGANIVGMDFYQFNVSPLASEVRFELFPTNGDVNLVLRKGRPVIDPLPTITKFDYNSVNPGLNKDEVLVITNSLPVNLAPGPWFAGVYNMEGYPVSYTIVATEKLNIVTNVIELISGVATNGQEGISPFQTTFYHLSISDTNPSVQFQLYNLTGNADLAISRGRFPSATNYDSLSAAAGTNNEVITIRTNFIVRNLNGDWYLTVVNRDTNTVNFTIRATVTPVFRALSNAVPVVNFVPAGPGWRYYSFNVSTNAIAATFELWPLNGHLGMYVLYPGGAAQWPSLAQFDYQSDHPGTNIEQVTLFTNSIPRPLTNGIWYIGVYNPNPFPVVYAVIASEFAPLAVPITTLINNQVLVRPPLGTNAVDYFQFQVSGTATQAVFETFNASGNIDLYIRKGLPLPSSTFFHYEGANPGAANETIVVLTNSVPLPLGPGWWYLTVTNVAAAPVSYSIRATEFTTAPLVIRPQIKITNNVVYITWNSFPGQTYTVQGKTNIIDPVWLTLSPVITASNQVTTFTLTLPNPFQYFFRVVP